MYPLYRSKSQEKKVIFIYFPLEDWWILLNVSRNFGYSGASGSGLSIT